MLNKSYREFSQIYDLLMNDVNYEKWTSFITDKIKGSKKILEAACGTGSVTSMLAALDYRVTAFDLSQDMLMRANEKIGRNPGIRLLNMDMTDFKIDDKFDAAICCCDGVNYITEDEAERFFKNIYNHLEDNSRFIFDISTRYKYDSMFNDTYVYDDGDIFYVWENVHDEESGSVNVEINFFVRDSLDKYIRINEVQTQYIHDTDTIERLLEKAGFSDVEIYDDYNDEPLREDSLRAVLCAVKK